MQVPRSIQKELPEYDLFIGILPRPTRRNEIGIFAKSRDVFFGPGFVRRNFVGRELNVDESQVITVRFTHEESM